MVTDQPCLGTEDEDSELTFESAQHSPKLALANVAMELPSDLARLVNAFVRLQQHAADAARTEEDGATADGLSKVRDAIRNDIRRAVCNAIAEFRTSDVVHLRETNAS